MRLRLPLFMLPRDTYERHSVVARHLRESHVASVLDVGGEGLLGRWLPGVKCVALNVSDSGDLRYDGKSLPFDVASFDAVVSLDTLEHLPRADRPHFVRELLRVAGRIAVLSAPFGSATHAQLEREALEVHRRVFGKDHQYLREHVDNGLPEVAELEALFAGCRHSLRFCGDCREQAAKVLRRWKRGGGEQSHFRDLVGILRDGNYWRKPQLLESPYEHANRVYVFVDLDQGTGLP